jgi:hypothetical protein
LRPDVRREPDRDVHGDKARLLGRGENVREVPYDANPNVLVVRADERRDPPSLAAIYPGDPLRRLGAFASPFVGEKLVHALHP